MCNGIVSLTWPDMGGHSLVCSLIRLTDDSRLMPLALSCDVQCESERCKRLWVERVLSQQTSGHLHLPSTSEAENDPHRRDADADPDADPDPADGSCSQMSLQYAEVVWGMVAVGLT